MSSLSKAVLRLSLALVLAVGLPEPWAWAVSIKNSGPGRILPVLPASPLAVLPAPGLSPMAPPKFSPSESAIPQAAAAPQGQSESVSARQALTAGAQKLLKASDDSDRRRILSRFFFGSAWRGADPEAVAADGPSEVASGPALKPASGVPGAAAPTPPSSAGPPSADMDKKAIFGLFAQRSVAIMAYVLTGIALPRLIAENVGPVGLGVLLSFGPLVAVGTGPLNGLVAKKLSARNAMAVNAAVRAALSLGIFVLGQAGALNFWTLLAASVTQGWLMSSIMTVEGVYFKRFSGGHLGTVNALAWINFLAIQAGLGLIAGAGRLVDRTGLMAPFLISAVVHAVLILPIIWTTIPNALASPAAAFRPRIDESFRRASAAARAFFGQYRMEAAFLAAGVASYFFIPVLSTIPAALALVWWISRTAGFKLLWADKPLRNGLLFSAAAAFLIFPLQGYSLPLISTELTSSKAGQAELLGELMGALYFGQLIANASQARLPAIRAPLIGNFSAQRLIQAGVLSLTAAWLYARLFPGNLAAAAAGLGLAALMMAISSKVGDRGWVRYLGVGLAFILLPIAHWSVPALLVGLVMIGLFYGPANVALSNYFYARLPKEKAESLIGIQGSLFNAAISLGFGAMTVVAAFASPVFPAALPLIAGAFIVAGVAFLFAPLLMPGLGGPKK